MPPTRPPPDFTHPNTVWQILARLTYICASIAYCRPRHMDARSRKPFPKPGCNHARARCLGPQLVLTLSSEYGVRRTCQCQLSSDSSRRQFSTPFDNPRTAISTPKRHSSGPCLRGNSFVPLSMPCTSKTSETSETSGTQRHELLCDSWAQKVCTVMFQHFRKSNCQSLWYSPAMHCNSHNLRLSL